MNKYIYIITILFVAGFSVSCVDDKAPEDVYGEGPDLAGFIQTEQTASAVANGDSYDVTILMEVKGPSLRSLEGDVTAVIGVNESATDAVEGVHYDFGETSITMSKSNNYFAELPMTIYSEGIEPPLILDLAIIVESVSGPGAEGVIPNGKPLEMSIAYLCDADLSGTYNVTSDACGGPGGVATISQNADGSWFLSDADGFFLDQCTANAGFFNTGSIVEVCGEIQPSNDLTYSSCCSIGNITGGTWDQDAGVLVLYNTQAFTTNWTDSWTTTYVRQ